MHFSSGINRPPYEGADGFLQITSGCSHATCEFCTFYKDSPFMLSPMEETVKIRQTSGKRLNLCQRNKFEVIGHGL